MPKPPVSPEEMERVRTASYRLVMQAPTMVGGNPIFATAALALAAVHASVMTDMTWEQFVELAQSYWESTSVALAVRTAQDAGNTVTAPGKTEGTS